MKIFVYKVCPIYESTIALFRFKMKTEPKFPIKIVIFSLHPGLCVAKASGKSTHVAANCYELCIHYRCVVSVNTLNCFLLYTRNLRRLQDCTKQSTKTKTLHCFSRRFEKAKNLVSRYINSCPQEISSQNANSNSNSNRPLWDLLL